jgi:hypothetical protein
LIHSRDDVRDTTSNFEPGGNEQASWPSQPSPPVEDSAAKLAAAIIRQEQETRPTANDTKPATDAADIEHAAGDVPAVTAR